MLLSMPLPRLIIGLLFIHGIILTSTVHIAAQIITGPQPQFLCPGDEVIFTCEIQANEQDIVLVWSSNEFIGENGEELSFASRVNNQGDMQFGSGENRRTFAELIEKKIEMVNGSVVSVRLVSKLHVRVSSNSSYPSVSCRNLGSASVTTKSFAVLDEPNAPRVFTAIQLEYASEKLNCSVCLMYSLWRYSPMNASQTGISKYRVLVNGDFTSPRTVSISGNSTTSVSYVFMADNCGTNELSVSAVNICGFESKISASFTIASIAFDPVLDEMCDDFLSAIGSAANKDCSLTIFIAMAMILIIFE